MRIVADTNTVVSALLWFGPPRRIFDVARAGTVELCTSADLLYELDEVLHRDKFAQRLVRAQVSSHELVLGYTALATLIEPAPIVAVVLADPDDDAVLACAIGANAEIIVTGDRHLLELKQYQNISILTASETLERLAI